MQDNIFRGIFDAAATNVISPSSFLLCLGVSLIIGLLFCCMSQWKSQSSESFAITIALLPAAVCVVIMMVNGNIGTGVAIAGAFSLVRFRSAAGSGREIITVFSAMAAGVMTGTGYLVYAIVFALVLGIAMMVYTFVHLGQHNNSSLNRQLRITIPESLNYEQVFDSVLADYTTSYILKQVKTTNMGSMFRLTYEITLRSGKSTKNLLDELRCLNGNLEISLNLQESDDCGL